MPDDFDRVAEEGLEPEPEEEDFFEEEAFDEPEGESTPDEADEPQEAATEEPAQAPQPWAAALREGETPEQAVPRLVGSIKQHKQAREELTARLERMEQRQEKANKFFEMLQKRAEEQEKKAEEEKLPDPELEPERRALHEVQELRKIYEKDREERTAAEEQRLQMYQARQQREALEAVDRNTYAEILDGLGETEGSEGDEEFKEAFDYLEASRWQTILARYEDDFRAMDPREAAQTAEELMVRLRLLEGREAARRGMSPKDWVKLQYRGVPPQLREGMKQYLEQARGAQPEQKNGASPAQPKRPSAKEVENKAKAAKKGAGMRRTHGRVGVKPPQTIDDFLDLPEEQQALLIEKGKVSEEEVWNALADEEFGVV